MSNIVVYGKKKTGKSLIKMLQKLNKEAILYDDETEYEDDLFTSESLVLVSPGVPPRAKGLSAAQKVGAEIMGETEFCFRYCKGKIISVTGTNGKTTVCEMTASILRDSGNRQTYLLGNGGVPFSEKVLDVQPDNIVVLESSSFQLYGCKSFAPYVAVLTNIAPDHLNWHESMDEYINAKKNNFLRMTDGFAIFNKDDGAAVELSRECKATKLYYSLRDNTANCYFDGENVILRGNGKESEINARFIGGFARHNVSNALAAILASCCAGAEPCAAVSSLRNFATPPHRLQKVDIIDGVAFIDDSKATNVHAAVSALNCVEGNIALILGGSDKGEDYGEIFRNAGADVKAVVAVGQTAEAIYECGKRFGRNVIVLGDFKQAARYCFDLLKPIGGTVLMSNACASFDSFGGFEERGDYFARAVKEIKSENQKS